MRLNEFDNKMRTYEESLDQYILDDMYMVVRLDGRGFTRLTKEICKFRVPFDDKFKDLMIEATKAVMDCGFNVLYGYTESDEISLLLAPSEKAFGRKVRKYNSTFAAEASATLSLALGMKATFDCRVIPLPNVERVKDYFIWRQEDATRGAINSWAYWSLRNKGMKPREASRLLDGMNFSDKNELLFSKFGINFNEVPTWQRRGIGLYWSSVEKEGINHKTNEEVTYTRRVITEDAELPIGEEYRSMIGNFLGYKGSICSDCVSYSVGFKDGLIQGKKEVLERI